MIFFKNAMISLFVKFLWVGLIFGVVKIVLNLISKVFRKNVYVVNLLSFVFWTAFGLAYVFLSIRLFNYGFSAVGFFAMLLGLVIIKISVEFFFDYFIRFIYNEFRNIRRKGENGKLQTNKKV